MVFSWEITATTTLNTKSSTEAKLVGVENITSLILWTQLFMEAQGYPIDQNILYQDNKSAILLETNGKRSSSKRTRHLNIRYFFLTDQQEKGNLEIQYCPTDAMVGDYMTKPLQGNKFIQFREMIMGPQGPEPTKTPVFFQTNCGTQFLVTRS